MDVQLGLTLSEQHRFRLFENRAWEYLGVRKKKWQEAGENCVMRSFIIWTFHGDDIKGKRWTERVARVGEMRNAFLVGEPEGKRTWKT
jgi:hypothetical protein